MTQLHNIRIKRRKRSVQRIGRGGKRGSYSGRGVKGQKSRAGRKLRPAQRDLILRLPKLRGFRNKPQSPKPKIFDLGDVSRAIQAGIKTGGQRAINRSFLVQVGMLSSRYGGEIKILSGGDISAPVIIEGISVSKKAREKIEKSGGKVL